MHQLGRSSNVVCGGSEPFLGVASSHEPRWFPLGSQTATGHQGSRTLLPQVARSKTGVVSRLGELEIRYSELVRRPFWLGASLGASTHRDILQPPLLSPSPHVA